MPFIVCIYTERKCLNLAGKLGSEEIRTSVKLLGFLISHSQFGVLLFYIDMDKEY